MIGQGGVIVGRPSKYPPDYQKRAIAMVQESGRPIKQVALELGVGHETLRRWVRQDEADRGIRSDRPTTEESAEIKRLRKENAELKRTNEILKLASAFFAQEADPARRWS